MNTNTIEITFSVKEDGSIQVVGQKAKEAVDGINKSVDQSTSPLEALKNSWIGVTAQITVGGFIIREVSNYLGIFVKAAGEAEQVSARLQYATQALGYDWSALAGHVDAFSESIRKSTRFSEEDAKRALNEMLLYTENYSEAQKGAKLAMDMSVRTGQDLSSTTRLIGMAMTGNVEILGRWIPQLKNLDVTLGSNASMSEKAAYTLKILNQQFGGSAQADIGTYAGKLAGMKSSWDELKKAIGDKALPVMKETFDVTKQWIDYLNSKDVISVTEKKTLLDIWGWKIERVQTQEIKDNWAKYGGASQTWLEQQEKGKKKEIDPYVAKYGMTESELLDRLSRSRLSREALYEQWNLESEKFAAEQQTIMDKIAGTWSGAEMTFPTEDILPDLMQITNQYGEILTVNKTYYDDIRDEKLAMAELLATVRQLKENTGAEFTYPTEDILPDWTGHPKTGKPVMVQDYKNQVNQMDTIFKTFGQDVSSVWAQNVTGILKGTESIGDAFKKMAVGMEDAFISAITKMITNYLLFGNVAGTGYGAGGSASPSAGTGWLGIFGTIGSWLHLQEGTNYVPQNQFAFLHKGEAVIPAEYNQRDGDSKGGGGGAVIVYNTTHHHNWYLQDGQTARDFIRRNKDAHLEIIKADADSANGIMRKIIKRLR